MAPANICIMIMARQCRDCLSMASRMLRLHTKCETITCLPLTCHHRAPCMDDHKLFGLAKDIR